MDDIENREFLQYLGQLRTVKRDDFDIATRVWFRRELNDSVSLGSVFW